MLLCRWLLQPVFALCVVEPFASLQSTALCGVVVVMFLLQGKGKTTPWLHIRCSCYWRCSEGLALSWFGSVPVRV